MSYRGRKCVPSETLELYITHTYSEININSLWRCFVLWYDIRVFFKLSTSCFDNFKNTVAQLEKVIQVYFCSTNLVFYSNINQIFRDTIILFYLRPHKLFKNNCRIIYDWWNDNLFYSISGMQWNLKDCNTKFLLNDH